MFKRECGFLQGKTFLNEVIANLSPSSLDLEFSEKAVVARVLSKRKDFQPLWFSFILFCRRPKLFPPLKVSRGPLDQSLISLYSYGIIFRGGPAFLFVDWHRGHAIG